jgi:cell division protein FtsL
MKGFPTTLFLLVVANFASALGVAYAEYLNHDLHQALRELELQRDDLGSEWGRLLLEQSTLADPPRVERIAGGQLGMIVPKQKDIVVIWP